VPDSRPGWYCGELHLHSDMSTGRADVATIARVAVERGLDFLGLTDHFTPSHWPRIEELEASGRRPLFLRSLELAGDRGHANPLPSPTT
jgi:PHP family Zn ribbon phosphoesterase